MVMEARSPVSRSRRRFIRGLTASPLVLCAPRFVRAADPLIRHDATSPMGLEMLAIYADAVRRMQAMGPDNPLSWMWQWYTHFVDGTTTKANEISRVFGTSTTTHSALANEVWNTCQSHAGQNPNHFLPWHRMFVYYFERIVRSVSGRADFTLPYWNYTSSDPTKRGILPEAFRLPDDPVFGPLYRPDRTSLANSGQPIHLNQPGDVMDISEAMAKTTYSSLDGVQGFCRSVDSGIHGRIHVLVGNSRNMGAVPYAGRDPLFWVHHANIDRMWASWNRNGGKNPSTDAWIETRFAMANELGVRVSRPLKTVFSILQLGYTYAEMIPRPPAPAPAGTTSLAASAERIAQSSDGAELAAGPVRASLLRRQGVRATEVLGLDAAAPGKRTYLVLKDLHAWKQPEVLFHVYLTPGRGNHAIGPANHVGVINFFDAEFHDHGNGAKGDVLGENFFSFDVTDVLRNLSRSAAKSDARDALFVTFAPAGRPTPGANPLVGTIELVTR